MNIIVILSFIPIIIWAFMVPLASRFSDVNTVTTSLGQIAGLLGMTLFSVNLILAGRFKFLDKYFKGLDKVYDKHRAIGTISFSLLLFHPLFLVVKYISFSLREAALFFVPFVNMPRTWGIISLALMIIILVLTFYIKLKYHIWKISHKFMTLAFAFAVLHVLVIPSDISRNALLKYYILLLAGIGLFVSLRKVLFYKSFKYFQYKITSVNLLNKDVAEIEMLPMNRTLVFTPGQFAFFSFTSDAVSRESHPFTISSSNKANNLKITVKNLGDYTNNLKNLKVNDEVSIDGPYGYFSYKKVSHKNQIWIAGGIGITPFLSMAESLNGEYNVDMYYSVKDEKEAVSLKELQNMMESNPNFKFNLWNVTEKGYINGELIANLSKGLDSKDIFLCGPPKFMESLKKQFITLGVDSENIHYENFSLF